MRPRQPLVEEPFHPMPCRVVSLAATCEHVPPKIGDVKSESGHCPPIARYGVVGVEALNDLLQPSALLRRCVVSSLPQLFLHSPERRLHAIATSAPLDKEVPCPRLTADERKSQGSKGFRLAKPASFSIGRRKATKLN